MKLLHGNCLELLPELEPNSVDLVFCDLPYGQTYCKWDTKIDLSELWKEVKRVIKPTTPIFFTCSSKFGYELIKSNEQWFRYDLVWETSSLCGFLNAKQMPMRGHEMIYVFYEKLPSYDISSRTRDIFPRSLFSNLFVASDKYIFIYTYIYYRIVYFRCFTCFRLVLKSKGNARLFSNCVWLRKCSHFLKYV